MSPSLPTEGRGTYWFLCGFCRHGRPHSTRCWFFPGHLLNQWVDFDHTYIDTWLGGGGNPLDFGDLDLIFKVTAGLKCQILTKIAVS